MFRIRFNVLFFLLSLSNLYAVAAPPEVTFNACLVKDVYNDTWMEMVSTKLLKFEHGNNLGEVHRSVRKFVDDNCKSVKTGEELKDFLSRMRQACNTNCLTSKTVKEATSVLDNFKETCQKICDISSIVAKIKIQSSKECADRESKFFKGIVCYPEKNRIDESTIPTVQK